MKTLATILLISMGLSFTSCICPSTSYKYSIHQDGNTYFTNVITTDKAGCISFVKGNGKDPVTICGNYTIEEDKNWKPELPKARKNR